MKKKLSLIFLLSVSVFFINAQENYVPGYIITNAGDTISGFIDFRTDAMNAAKCSFKSQENAVGTIYSPGDILSYRFIPDGKYYVSHDVKIGDQTQKIFLEYLVQGMVDLFYCRIGELKYFFWQEDGQMIEITKNPDRIDDNKIVKDNKYKGVISYYFRDYPTIRENIKKMDFDQKSFIKMAKLYHDKTCTTGEECIIYENKNPDKSYLDLKFMAYAGLQFGTYTMICQNDKYKFNGVQPIIGLKGSLCNPRWSKSFSGIVDISLSRFSSSKDIVSKPYEVHYDLKTMIFTGKIGLEYKFSMTKLRPFIGGGLNVACPIANTSKYNLIDTSDKQRYNYKMRSSFLGYFVNLGGDYMLGNNHAIEARISMERYTSNDRNLESGLDKYKSYNIILGYIF